MSTASIARCARRPASSRGPSGRPSFATAIRSALASARVDLSRDILFYQYVQWIAAEQWQAVRMGTEGIEILGDFPFMVTLDSADVWSRQEDFMLDASVGTPPDAFSETGQEWGLPPYNWDRGARERFRVASDARAEAGRSLRRVSRRSSRRLLSDIRAAARRRTRVLHAGGEPAQTALGEADDADHDGHGGRCQRRRSRNRSRLCPRVDRAPRPARIQGAALGAWRSGAVSGDVGRNDRHARHRDAGGLVGIDDRRGA